MTHPTPHHTPDVAADQAFDVAIVGKGFAGLSAAQVLGRAQRRVLLIGAGPTRNAEAIHAHNFLTRDGTPPADLLAAGLAEIEGLSTVTIRPDLVDAVRRDDDGSLSLRGPHGERIEARHVVLATGARDRLPDVPGLPALWGRRAHSCPFCDGAEYAGRRLLVLASEPAATRLHALLSSWTTDIVLADPESIQRLGEQDGDVVVTRADGNSVTVDGVFVHTDPLPRVDLVADLALARRGDYVATDGIGRTSLAGLWAAGDCAWRNDEPIPGGQVVAAMAAGARSAASIVLQLQGIEIPATPPSDPPRTAERLSPPAGKGPHELPEGMGLQEFWEGHYATADQVWTGEPNMGLVRVISDITPGTALELGCGEGGDAVWLAERGWEVTGIDVSETAISRATTAATRRGLDGRITFKVADLGEDAPVGHFGLVVAAYLLSPIEIPRDYILRSAANAVEPGGTLVILSHVGMPGGGGHGHLPMPSVAEQLEALAFGGDWTVTLAEEFTRTRRNHDGTMMQHVDSVIAAVRPR